MTTLYDLPLSTQLLLLECPNVPATAREQAEADRPVSVFLARLSDRALKLRQNALTGGVGDVSESAIPQLLRYMTLISREQDRRTQN